MTKSALHCCNEYCQLIEICINSERQSRLQNTLYCRHIFHIVTERLNNQSPLWLILISSKQNCFIVILLSRHNIKLALELFLFHGYITHIGIILFHAISHLWIRKVCIKCINKTKWVIILNTSYPILYPKQCWWS